MKGIFITQEQRDLIVKILVDINAAIGNLTKELNGAPLISVAFPEGKKEEEQEAESNQNGR